MLTQGKQETIYNAKGSRKYKQIHIFHKSFDFFHLFRNVLARFDLPSSELAISKLFVSFRKRERDEIKLGRKRIEWMNVLNLI